MSSEQPRKLEFTWEGALADLKDQYTSVELQHEAMYWRDGDFYLGYLKDYPDYQTQGYSKEELINNLKGFLNDPILQARGMLKGKEGGTVLFMQDKQEEFEKEEHIVGADRNV